MKRFVFASAALAALMLAACASAPNDAAPEAAAPETAQTAEAAAETAAFTVGTLRRIPTQSYCRSGLNTGSGLYSAERYHNYGYWINTFGFDYDIASPLANWTGFLVYTDYKTLTQTPVCNVPGCTHDTLDCPARCVFFSVPPALVRCNGELYLIPEAFDVTQYGDNYFETLRQSFTAQLGAEGLTTADSPALQYAAAVLDQLCEQAQGPLYIEKIDADRKTHTRVAPLPDDWTSGGVQLCWQDDEAVYGQIESKNCGVRIALADGSTQYFDLLPEETIVDGIGSRFLTCRVQSGGAFPTDQSALNAVLQNAWVEFSLLDAATGARETVYTCPYDAVHSMGADLYVGHDEGGLWLRRYTNDENLNMTAELIRYNLATGEELTWGSVELDGSGDSIYEIYERSDWLLTPQEQYPPYLKLLTMQYGDVLFDIENRNFLDVWDGDFTLGGMTTGNVVYGDADGRLMMGDGYTNVLALVSYTDYLYPDGDDLPLQEIECYTPDF